MTEKYLEYFGKLKSKKIAVVGIGISNTPLIKMLCSFGAIVTACDKKEKSELTDIINELQEQKVNFKLGDDYLKNLNDFDIIFKTPGMRFDIPELVFAAASGAVVTSEMEVFFELCPAKIIAVTGSDGKTTTTTLIYKILEKSGVKCHLGGNIGNPILPQIANIKKDDIVVLELSSFQLHTMKKSAHIAVITNITPNHLDMHKSMGEYVDAKKNIFKFQNENDKLILNFENDITKGFEKEAASEVLFFSSKNKPKNGIYIDKNNIYIKKDGKESLVIRCDDIILPGVHNVENYMAAILAVWDFVDVASIKEVANTFMGVAHRIEFVREIDGIKFYNSSIDSSPNRTRATLNVFNQRVILISGGKDKNIPYDELGSILVKKVKKLILIGATAEKIYNSLKAEIEKTKIGTDISVFRAKTYQEAVEISYKEAEEGDIVVLSPASTSFDMFKNFEERGNLFKNLVNKL